jgi:hypothetical protein
VYFRARTASLGILVSRIDLMLLDSADPPLSAALREDVNVLQRAAGRLTISLELLLTIAASE